MVVVLNFLRWAFPLAIAASFLYAARPYAALEAATDKVELRIEVYAFAGFHVLTNRTTVETSGGRYAITMDIGTRGIAALFIDLNSHSTVDGRFDGNAAFPETYRSELLRNGVDRRYRIDYAAAGPAASEWAPPATAWQPLFPPARLRGTVDQLTAYFLVERQLAEHGNCNLDVPVFDGHSRYDLRFKDASANNSAVARPQDYAGPTHLCDVARDDIAGFPVNNDPTEGTYKKGRVWYARIGPAGQMVPVQIDYDTEFGIVTGYLADLRGPDGNLTLSR
jgi:Protein of unknown function (DUF3108)